MESYHHFPVMIDEVVQFLNCRTDGIYLDCTLGEGGHAFEILKRSSPTGRLVGIDCDFRQIEVALKRLESFQERINIVHGNYAHLGAILDNLHIKKVDGILLDLGISSCQLDSRERGFSFQLESPLDMRFDQKTKLSAYEVVNGFSVTKIKEILNQYGEERWAGRIAGAIDKKRNIQPISNTKELAEIIISAVPRSGRYGRIHPATRTFQALRIVVNNELDNLRKCINEGVDLLNKGGRFCIISFHSLEDRIVKHSFKNFGINNPPLNSAILKIITKKPIGPKKSEVAINPRARSSKLRVVERI